MADMTENSTLLTQLTDEAAIRDISARFGMAATTQDYETFRTLWAPDGVWRIGAPYAQRAEGIDDISAMLRRFWEGNDYFMQFTAQGPIDIDGDTATSRSLCQEFGSGPNGRYYRTHGIWTDRFRRLNGGWVFTERAWQYLWVDFSPFTGDTFPLNP